MRERGRALELRAGLGGTAELREEVLHARGLVERDVDDLAAWGARAGRVGGFLGLANATGYSVNFTMAVPAGSSDALAG